MENELLGIGPVARLSGLSISALRFYDTAGLLRPAVVEEHNGYRWYELAQVDQARLVARLRRVGMALPAIASVLAADNQVQALAVLDEHHQRLIDGLHAAQHELSCARALLEQMETTMSETTWMTINGADLAAELEAVRFAAGQDPEFPALGGILLDADPAAGRLRLVATDRYRMAVGVVSTADGPGSPMQVTAASEFVGRMIELLHDQAGPVRLGLQPGAIVLEAGPQQVRATALAGDFPPYRRLIPTARTTAVTLDVARFRQEVVAAGTRRQFRAQDGEPYEVSVLVLGPDGTVHVADEGQAGEPGAEAEIGVNREFLLQALDARGASELLLELDGPIAPLALRDPRQAESVSLLMPARLA